MKINQEKLEELRQLIKEVKQIQKFFIDNYGVDDIYANSKICITLTPIGLALKLPEKDIKSLINKDGAKPLQYFPEGPIKKEYVLLPGSIVGDSKKLQHWVKLSIEYVTR